MAVTITVIPQFKAVRRAVIRHGLFKKDEKMDLPDGTNDVTAGRCIEPSLKKVFARDPAAAFTHAVVGPKDDGTLLVLRIPEFKGTGRLDWQRAADLMKAWTESVESKLRP